jgi:hypothetical protein
MTQLPSDKPELFKGRHFNSPRAMILQVWEAALAA